MTRSRDLVTVIGMAVPSNGRSHRAGILLSSALVLTCAGCHGEPKATVSRAKANRPRKVDGTLILCGGNTELDPASSATGVALRALVRQLKVGDEKPGLSALLSASGSSVTARRAWAGSTSDPGYRDTFHLIEADPRLIPLAIDTYAGKSYFQSVTVAGVAEDRAWADQIRKSKIVFLNGGDQIRHTRALLRDDGTDSALLAAIRDVLENGGVVMGTSAGTHVQGVAMFGNGVSYDYLAQNKIHPMTLAEQLSKVEYSRDSSRMTADLMVAKDGFVVDRETGTREIQHPSLEPPDDPTRRLGSYGRGIGLLDRVLLDSHSAEQGRLGRMTVALATVQNDANFHDTRLAIGVDENTCLVWHRKERTGEVIGERGVWIVELGKAQMTPPNQAPFAAKNVEVSYLSAGDRFDTTPDGGLGTITSALRVQRNSWKGEGEFPGDLFAPLRTRDALHTLYRKGWNKLSAQSLPPTGRTGKPHRLQFSIGQRTRVFGETAPIAGEECRGCDDRITIDRLLLSINGPPPTPVMQARKN